MKSHFMLHRGVAMACAVTGATAMLDGNRTAQAFTAADYATNSAYADGWQEGDNGGFGFTPWGMNGTYNSADQHSMDTNSTYNQLGVAWTIFNPDSYASGTGSNPPDGGTDGMSRAGRGFSPLQVGQTISTVIDNPTERRFYKGYTIRLVSGGQNVGYCCPGVSKLAVGTFEYFTYGRWYAGSGSPNLFDTDTAAAGMRLDVTLTGPNNYKLTMTPLANPGSAYTEVGTLAGTDPVDWIEFEFYNTDSDWNPSPGTGTLQATDFYIRSITITEVQPIGPEFVAQPASQSLYPGRTARFKASAIGAPLSYQWRKNGANLTNGGNISGVLTDTLIVNNVGAGDVAAYTLVATNSALALAVTSAPPATLTLVQPGGTPYESAVLAANPVAHWGLNEVANPATNPPAFDYWGGYAGTYGNAASNGFNSIAGPKPNDWPGFENNNSALKATASTAQSWVTIPALNLNTNAVTLTAWIYPLGDQTDYTGVLYTRRGSTAAAGINYTLANQIGYTVNNVNETWQFESGLIPPANQWSLVALVVEPGQATIYLYTTNGLASAINGIANENIAWDGIGFIGGDPDNNINRTFDGRIDEVAVFNHAFTPAQVLNLYNSALQVPVTLIIQRIGANVRLIWPQGTLLEATNVTGPYTTNINPSPYTFAPSGAKKFFKVIVQ